MVEVARSDAHWGIVSLKNTYSSGGGLVVAGLASELQASAIGQSVLDLDGAGREVVEILVEEL